MMASTASKCFSKILESSKPYYIIVTRHCSPGLARTHHPTRGQEGHAGTTLSSVGMS